MNESNQVPEPSVEEFRQQIADERARQIDDGYDIIHDRAHGVDHLLMWAQDYARRGRAVQSAALVEAARELLSKSPEPQGEPSDAWQQEHGRHWWACAVNAPHAEWRGPCDCDLSRDASLAEHPAALRAAGGVR